MIPLNEYNEFSDSDFSNSDNFICTDEQTKYLINNVQNAYRPYSFNEERDDTFSESSEDDQIEQSSMSMAFKTEDSRTTIKDLNNPLNNSSTVGQCRIVLSRRITAMLLSFLINARDNVDIALRSSDSISNYKIPWTRSRASTISMILTTLKEINDLLIHDRFLTKRDLFYLHKSMFKNQRQTDRCLSHICRLFEVNRTDLHVISAPKGTIIGDLVYIDGRDEINDCRVKPTLISSHAYGAKDFQTTAKFVLVVEKDAIFQKLFDESAHVKLGPCIIMTGRGYPDQSTRSLLRRLTDAIPYLPAYCLVDADPHGIDIFCTYKFGPKKMSGNNNLATPGLQFLGLRRDEIHDHFQSNSLIDINQALPISRNEVSKIYALKCRPEVQSDLTLMRELDTLYKMNTKYELEAISSCGMEYLTNVYLTTKLAHLFENISR